MSRFAEVTRVFFVEEPMFGQNEKPSLDITVHIPSKVTVIVPQLPAGISDDEAVQIIQKLLQQYMHDHLITPGVFWYYSPMALRITRSFSPVVSVYDCMDELTGFLFAPVELKVLEAELFQRVDVVFTGGNTLYKAKKQSHSNVHPFPSSIDKSHFAKARTPGEEPLDQAQIPYPRLGFYGVLDERLDLDLVAKISSLKPDWSFIFVGPVVKIDPATLPGAKNIHYLGSRTYDLLPSYLAGWDIAMMPFARNDSTRFISPTKTPEYLAGGKQVISTSIMDVVHDYGNRGLVEIADTPEEFIAKVEKLLASPSKEAWLKAVDQHLADMSWDNTWWEMKSIILWHYEKNVLKNKNINECSTT